MLEFSKAFIPLQTGWGIIVETAKNALDGMDVEDTVVGVHEEEFGGQDRCPPAWAFRGPGGEGTDSVIFLKTLDNILLACIFQSKKHRIKMSKLQGSTETFKYMLAECRKDLAKHRFAQPTGRTIGDSLLP